jgi:hypothetical protein
VCAPVCPPTVCVNPCVVPNHCNDVFVEADFLYWYAKQNGNQYASTGTALTVPGTLDPNTLTVPPEIESKGKIRTPDFGMDPGFKLALGINLDHGKWDLLSEYTFFYSSAHDSVASGNSNTGILPLFSYIANNSILSHATFASVVGATGYVSGASANWNLHFNTILLELGRMINPFPFLSVRPHFGLEGTWQKQNLNAYYTVSSIATGGFIGENKVSFEQSSWGIGPRLGLDTVWGCWKHVGLFANVAASALWSGFDAEAKSYDTQPLGGYANRLIADQENNTHSIVPVLQMEIGGQFDWVFCNQYRFLMQAGWESQVWFFQNQHSSVIADTSLILQGLTIKFRFDF